MPQVVFWRQSGASGVAFHYERTRTQRNGKMMTTATNSTRYTFTIYHNGREVENLDPWSYATEEESERAGLAELDSLCPRHSPNRKFYRVETMIVQ